MKKSDFSVIVSLNPLAYDARLLRLARCLPGEVLVLGLRDPHSSQDFSHWPGAVRLASRPFPRLRGAKIRALLSAASYLHLILRTAYQLRGRRGMVWAADADGLPFGWLLARVLGGRLVYDAHEFWPVEAGRRGMSRWLRTVEKALIGQAHAVATVSPAMAEAYQRTYALAQAPSVILNTPDDREAPPAFSLQQPGVFTLLYHGHLVRDRRLLDFVRAFRRRPEGPRMRLAFLGHGPLCQELRALQAEDLVVYPAVPPQQLVPLARTASAGLVLLNPCNVNHQLTLTNKLFEYLRAGIPVLATDCCPEMNRILRDFQVGTVFAGEAAVPSALQALLPWLEQPGAWRDNFQRAQQAYRWDLQRESIQQIVKG